MRGVLGLPDRSPDLQLVAPALFKLDRAPGGLARIALEAGFSSHSHFTKAFRLEFGSAPSSLFAAPRARGHESPASPASR